MIARRSTTPHPPFIHLTARKSSPRSAPRSRTKRHKKKTKKPPNRQPIVTDVGPPVDSVPSSRQASGRLSLSLSVCEGTPPVIHDGLVTASCVRVRVCVCRVECASLSVQALSPCQCPGGLNLVSFRGRGAKNRKQTGPGQLPSRESVLLPYQHLHLRLADTPVTRPGF